MVDTVVGRELAKRGCAFGEASDCHTFHHGLLNDFSKKNGGRQEAFIIFELRFGNGSWGFDFNLKPLQNHIYKRCSVRPVAGNEWFSPTNLSGHSPDATRFAEVSIFIQNVFQRLETPFVFLRRADGDADPFRQLIAAHRTHNHAQLLQFPKHALAVADAHQDEICL